MIKLTEHQKPQLLAFYKKQDRESLRLRFCRYMTDESLEEYVNGCAFTDNSCVNACLGEKGEIISVIESIFSKNILGVRIVEVALMVDSEHRRKGLGKKMLKFVIDRAIPEYADVIKSHCMASNCWMTKLCIENGMKIENFGSEIVATRMKEC